jgi:UDP-2,3-diacylglucosamine pyrophosphatase LpxH
MRKEKVDRSVYLNDLHIPYQDDAAVHAALELTEYLAPSHIFLCGDLADFYAFSKFDRDPNRVLQAQAEFDQVFQFLKELRSRVGEAKIYWLEGNHERRLTAYLCQHPEIANLDAMRPERLFRLDEVGVEWVGYEDLFTFHEFVVTHGSVVRKASGASAKGEHEHYGVSGISGHTHRAAIYRHTNLAGEYLWVENGCLCDLHPKYVKAPDWHHCLAVGTFLHDSSRFQIEQVQINGGKLLYDDLMFGASN